MLSIWIWIYLINNTSNETIVILTSLNFSSLSCDPDGKLDGEWNNNGRVQFQFHGLPREKCYHTCRWIFSVRCINQNDPDFQKNYVRDKSKEIKKTRKTHTLWSMIIYTLSFFSSRAILGVHKSKGLHDLGSVKLDLAVCLFAVYVICYFSLWKGISTSGKVVWFTALFPYFVLSILLIRGITLPGAFNGMKYYLKPEFTKIKDAGVSIFSYNFFKSRNLPLLFWFYFITHTTFWFLA